MAEIIEVQDDHEGTSDLPNSVSQEPTAQQKTTLYR